MDFKNANELLDLCKKHDLPISEVMRQREIVEGEKEADTVHNAMARVLEIMKNAAFTPIKEPVRSMGGLIGGEAKKIASRYHSGRPCGWGCYDQPHGCIRLKSRHRIDHTFF